MKISVIVPMYNSSKTIINTLNSIKEQTYRDFEIIVIDDGSNDDSSTLVEDFILSNDELPMTLLKKANGGVSSARNMGIKAAQGDYIALLDSDDRWLPEKLNKQVKILNSNPEISFIGTLHNNLKLGFPYSVNGDLIKVSFRQLLIKMAPSTITSLFKKDLINAVGGYDENQKYAEDGNLWLRFSKVCKMVILNENLAIAGDMKPLYGHSGLSGSLAGMQEGELKNIREMHDLGYLNYLEFKTYSLYSNLKYWRRCIVVKLRSRKI